MIGNPYLPPTRAQLLQRITGRRRIAPSNLEIQRIGAAIIRASSLAIFEECVAIEGQQFIRCRDLETGPDEQVYEYREAGGDHADDAKEP